MKCGPADALPDAEHHQHPDEAEPEPDRTRAAVSRSVRKTSTASGSTISGVVAFQMPASIDETRCSP